MTAPDTARTADLAAIVRATDFRPRYPWLDPSSFDAKAQLVHDGGVVDVPGRYLLWPAFLRRRKSN